MHHNNYPVVEPYPGGIYEPLKRYPVSHWRNKNRIPRTIEEIDDAVEEAFGVRGFLPIGHEVCVLEFNPAAHSRLIQTVDNTNHWWNVGKIIALGELCFDSLTFPKGAPGTFNDYVIFDAAGVKRTKFEKGNMLSIPDTNVKYATDDPFNYIKGLKRDQ